MLPKAGAEIRESDVTLSVQQHVVRLYITVHVAQLVDGIYSQHHLCYVEPENRLGINRFFDRLMDK